MSNNSKCIGEILGCYTIEEVSGRVRIFGIEYYPREVATFYKCDCRCHQWDKYGGPCPCKCGVGVGKIDRTSAPLIPYGSLKGSFGWAEGWPPARSIAGWFALQTLSVQWL